MGSAGTSVSCCSNNSRMASLASRLIRREFVSIGGRTPHPATTGREAGEAPAADRLDEAPSTGGSAGILRPSWTTVPGPDHLSWQLLAFSSLGYYPERSVQSIPGRYNGSTPA